MIYLLWTLPALAVIGLIATGRAGTLFASVIGLAIALVVALTCAPISFAPQDAGIAMLRGVWIGWIVVPYILGGLLFWQMAIRPGNAAVPVESLRTMNAPDADCSSRPAFSSVLSPSLQPASA
ncbi:hypothetical protein WH297_25085 [Ochrobactrum vermis]|uniref:Uncharacterized protein n=1 Tax=Ochrobactrum vermis TaxID=1827297 RepID=A0ABU8PND2_9HYPH|nr:hypothetical protein [Ochrobactrum vermis]